MGILASACFSGLGFWVLASACFGWLKGFKAWRLEGLRELQVSGFSVRDWYFEILRSNGLFGCWVQRFCSLRSGHAAGCSRLQAFGLSNPFPEKFQIQGLLWPSVLRSFRKCLTGRLSFAGFRELQLKITPGVLTSAVIVMGLEGLEFRVDP